VQKPTTMADSITARFNVGSKFVIATFDYSAVEENLEGLLEEFINQEDIPIYLEDSLYSTISRIVDEYKKDPKGPNYYKCMPIRLCV
jgi:hypothetical protein